MACSMPTLWLHLWLQGKPCREALSLRREVSVHLASVINEPPKWWLDTLEPEHHRCAQHRTYRLTCCQYDRLLARASDRCEICSLPAAKNARGCLFLDHDHALGWWAVRGLLCRACNARLRDPAADPRTVLYGEQAFHLTLTREAGVSLDLPEPKPGSVVVDHAMRPWRREAEGWWPLKPHHSTWVIPISWARLIFQSGPHNLRTARLDADVPPMGPIHNGRIAREFMGATLPSEGVFA